MLWILLAKPLRGDVPVGAVIYAPTGEILATATNRREADRDPTAHAEIIALRRAARRFPTAGG